MTPESIKSVSSESTTTLARGDRWRLPLYWLAGARWESLREQPQTEQERVAVLGSTVLIPTVLAFFGMAFYATSRLGHWTPWVLPASIVWAFVIMNTDRVLLATYRPFYPLYLKVFQLVFRVGLAAVISFAIALPFCLDQYRSAITHRYRLDLQAEMGRLEQQEQEERVPLEAAYRASREAKTDEAEDLQKQALPPELFASGKLSEEMARANDESAPAISPRATALNAQKQALEARLAAAQARLDSQRDLYRRLVNAAELERAGKPNEFYPESKKEGRGRRLIDLEARIDTAGNEIKAAEAAGARDREALRRLEDDIGRQRAEDRAELVTSVAQRRQLYLQQGADEASSRTENIRQLRADVAQLDQDHALEMKRHEDRFFPQIDLYKQKMGGILDPMEETIGLYRVIFDPRSGSGPMGPGRFAWLAGVLQFVMIFGTLFVLDLIPILAKAFAAPGSYDVLVAYRELVAAQNLRAFKREYPRYAMKWAQGEGVMPAPGTALDARDSAGLTRALLTNYSPTPYGANGRTTYGGEAAGMDSTLADRGSSEETSAP